MYPYTSKVSSIRNVLLLCVVIPYGAMHLQALLSGVKALFGLYKGKNTKKVYFHKSLHTHLAVLSHHKVQKRHRSIYFLDACIFVYCYRKK